jgi:hypothetical protein
MAHQLGPSRQPEALSFRQCQPDTRLAFTSLKRDRVPPPGYFDVVVGQGEELNECREGDARGEGGREDKVVLQPSRC